MFSDGRESRADVPAVPVGLPASAGPIGASPALCGAAVLPRPAPRKWEHEEKGQPLFQLIFDELIDNKIKEGWFFGGGGGGVLLLLMWVGALSGAGKDDLSCLSICQALSQRSAREERVINRLEVISDVSVFLPCFQVIMFTGSRPPGSLPSY